MFDYPIYLHWFYPLLKFEESQELVNLGLGVPILSHLGLGIRYELRIVYWTVYARNKIIRNYLTVKLCLYVMCGN